MDTTVILCTYNRCQSLAKALESIAASRMPEPTRWEVLVVDNNSQDETRAVADEYCQRNPDRFRYLFEGKQGKSHALNSGIHASTGRILAFVDDDVTVDADWLHNLTAPLNSGEWSGAGGRILPETGFVPPRWLDVKSRYALAPLAMFDLGGEAGVLNEAPFGTNMAFRREMFSKYGTFRTDLGPRPGSEIRNEDTEFGARLLGAGERLWYEPSAVVYHTVPEHRVQKRYMLTWWFDKARADMREYGVQGGTRWFIARMPLYLFRRLGVWTARWLTSFHPRRRFSYKVKVWGIAGALQECRSHSTVARGDKRQRGGHANAISPTE